MPTIAVDKAALFKALGQEWVQIQIIDRLLILELAGIQPRNSTSYALNSVSGVMPGDRLPVLNPPRYRAR